MSDISIPGVSSRFNTESMVQELVEAESVRLERMNSELETYQAEKRVWQELNAGLNNLRQSARALYSFENPFNERNAISDNEAVLRATATREASEGVTEVRVLQVAQADRFISDDIDRELQIEQGIYTFTVGDDSVTVRFRGGSVKEFSRCD
jgi:flagellar hook-associated protein 2